MQIKVKTVRKKTRVSLRSLEKRTGLSRSKLYRIETGVVDPRLSDLECIAKALHVRISDLYDSEYK